MLQLSAPSIPSVPTIPSVPSVSGIGSIGNAGNMKLYTVGRVLINCLLIANCEFFHNSHSKESQLKEYKMNITRNHAPSARAFSQAHIA